MKMERARERKRLATETGDASPLTPEDSAATDSGLGYATRGPLQGFLSRSLSRQSSSMSLPYSARTLHGASSGAKRANNGGAGLSKQGSSLLSEEQRAHGPVAPMEPAQAEDILGSGACVFGCGCMGCGLLLVWECVSL